MIAILAVRVFVHPFERVTALAALAVAASFVDNGGGHVTRELAVITLIALYAIAIPVLLGVMALALDGGKLFVSKIHVQNAAESSKATGEMPVWFA